MSDRRSDLRALAGVLFGGGLVLLTFKAAQRGDIGWWTDPISWIGAVLIASGAAIFLGLLVPPWVVDRRARRARHEAAIQEGRANQRQGLDEIGNELGQISSQLKAELRWGKRGPLFPNTERTKNQHLVTGDVRATVDSAYAQVHTLDKETLAASQEELDAEETQKRQRAKATVDEAAGLIASLRDEVEL